MKKRIAHILGVTPIYVYFLDLLFKTVLNNLSKSNGNPQNIFEALTTTTMNDTSPSTIAVTTSRRGALKTLGSAIGVAMLNPLGACSKPQPKLNQAGQLKDPIFYSSASSIAEAIKSKKISSEEITRIYIDRIKQVNPQINAVVQLASELALEAARKADQVLANGDYLGPLHGVPMTIKDSFDTAGIISTAGTLGRADYIPGQDAAVVARLKQAGAILMGKTNTPELTLAGETTNLVYGQTNNPYKLSASPGGSSGGAAAIISSGGSAFDIGTDTGGSVRNPAHCCGLCGIRPTSGRVPRTGHIVSFDRYDQALTTAGPLARNVEDLIRILPVISGPDGIDPFIYEVPLGNPDNVEISDLKFAWYTEVGSIKPTQEIGQVFTKVADDISNRNAKIEEVHPAGIEQTLELFFEIVLADQGYSVNKILTDAGTSEISALLDWAERPEGGYESPSISAKQFSNLFERWSAYNSSLTTSFKDYDIVLCPASSLPAPLQGFKDTPQHTLSYTASYNMTGWPAAVVRVGVSSDGLPIGIQIVGKPWQEDKVLAVAKYLEKTFGGFQPPLI